MSNMSEKELNQIVQNEIEWRKQLWKKVETTQNDLNDFKVDMATITTTLKVKIAVSSTFFGLISGGVISLIIAIMQIKK